MTPALNFKIVGQGPPVVILHGLFGMMDNWLSIAKRFEEKGYMSFLVDQRDHGRSEHTDAINYSLLANDLHNFLEENWIHDTILIGHSMGGKTGLKFVSEYGSMVSKFIVIDIGIKQYIEGHLEVFNALFAVNPEQIQSREEAYEIMMSKLGDSGTVQFLMKNLTRKKTGGFEWKMNLPLIYRDYKNILEEITFDGPCETKTCFIRGANSNYILDEDIDKIRSVFPNSTFITIEGAGHWVHADKPDELFKQIIAFIQD